MKTTRLFLLLLALLCATATWAQPGAQNVYDETGLRSAVKNNAIIRLQANITLSSSLVIDVNGTVGINLNNYTLNRGLTKRGENGQVIFVKNGSTLTLGSGTLTGGWGGDSGGILNEGTVEMTNVTITGCTGDDRGGGILNRSGGILTMRGGSITNNTSNDKTDPKGGGGLFNYEGATATLTGVTITGNKAKLTGGGGICNFGTLTIDGCTIKDNTAGSQGGAIWQEGTLNMKGANTLSGNTASSGSNNVYLYSGKVITVTGSLAGSDIGITMQKAGVFTSGYNANNSGVDPATLFTPDLSGVMAVSLANNEAQLANALPEGSVYYIERSWDSENKQVVNTTKTLSRQIGYGDTPTAGDYKFVTNSVGDGWFQLGGYSDDDEYYVVSGNVSNNTLNVLGKNVHLILLDGAKLTLATGILMYGDHNLYIHSQSYGSSMGKLIAQSGHDDNAAGIGSDGGDYDDYDIRYTRTPGNIEIHGGDIYAKGGYYGAGIGGGNYQNASIIIIYGGKVEARGGGGGVNQSGTPGIGGGEHGGCGHITIYDGTVYAYGGEYGPGIGTGVKVETIGGEAPRGANNSGYNISMNNTVDIYGGRIEAHGGPGGAGIGGAVESNGVILTVNGGEVYAYGGEDAAGIGGGWWDNGCLLTVNGGYVYAKGDGNGAGIGSGSEGPLVSTVHGGLVVINGGEVYAYGGVDAAGIGGGEDADGGKVIITGGQVYAYGDGDAAGIGGGQDGGGGDVRIRGGYVYAEGKGDGAGIGGGEDGDGGYVSITDGTVVVKAGGDQRAIGAGYGSDNHGSLDFASKMGVFVTTNLYRSKKENRVKDCRNFQYVKISECLHGDATYTVSGTTADDTHTAHCSYCTMSFSPEKHTFENGKCTVCGVESTAYDVRIYLPKDQGSGTYDGQTYSSQTTQMVPGNTFTMPDCPTTVPGLEFKGWLASTTVTSETYTSSYTTSGETLLAAGDEYTINNSVSFIARYQALDISLADNASNSETLVKYGGMTANSVTLSGRTFKKDGDWNTLCLPFDVTAAQVAETTHPLYGATIMELDTDGTYKDSKNNDRQTGFDATDGTLYLYFKTANSIEAGKPYIVKWTGGGTIEDPAFSNVTINNVLYGVRSKDRHVAFAGIYSPKTIAGEDRTILFVGAENQLYYPNGEAATNINSFRAHFQLKGITAGDVAHSRLFFGDDETNGITTTNLTNFTNKAGAWFDLSGRKLDGKPTKKGVYIHEGRKVVIK